MRNRLFIAVLCLLCPVQLCLAQQFWESRPWEEWTTQEVDQMLTNSPWTHSVTPEGVAPKPTERGNKLTASAVLEPQAAAPNMIYEVQLQSALTVRRAMARRAQLLNGYDNGWPRNPALDAQLSSFLAKPFPETIVVDVKFHSESTGALAPVSKFWAGKPDVKSSVMLEAGGKKFRLSELQSLGPYEFALVFPRPKKLPRNGSVIVKFPNAGGGDAQGAGARRPGLRVEFKLSEMTVNGVAEL